MNVLRVSFGQSPLRGYYGQRNWIKCSFSLSHRIKYARSYTRNTCKHVICLSITSKSNILIAFAVQRVSSSISVALNINMRPKHCCELSIVFIPSCHLRLFMRIIDMRLIYTIIIQTTRINKC